MALIIDVREPDEYKSDHAEGAINIPPDKIIAGPKELENIDKDTLIIVYCRSGSRSNASIHYLKKLGFRNVVNGINKDHIRSMSTK